MENEGNVKKERKKISTGKSLIVIVIGVAIISTAGYFAYKQSQKSKLINFEGKFLACVDTELDVTYDFINGMIKERDKVEKDKKLLDIYKEIDKNVPTPLKADYKEFVDAKAKVIVNYGHYTEKDSKAANSELGDMLKAMNAEGDKLGIDKDKMEECRSEYVKKYREEIK